MIDAVKANANEESNEIDDPEEEDPIIEDVSRVDLTNLEVISRWSLSSDENTMTNWEAS